MKTKAEIWMMQPQTNEHLKSQAERDKERLTSRDFKSSTALQTPWFQALASKTVIESISVVLNDQVCGPLLKKPQKAIQGGHSI